MSDPIGSTVRRTGRSAPKPEPAVDLDCLKSRVNPDVRDPLMKPMPDPKTSDDAKSSSPSAEKKINILLKIIAESESELSTYQHLRALVQTQPAQADLHSMRARFDQTMKRTRLRMSKRFAPKVSVAFPQLKMK